MNVTPILALDLGTATGWAMRSHSGLIHGGTTSFAMGPRHGPGVRFLRFRRWLRQMAGEANGKDAPLFQAVFYEEVQYHASIDAAHCYGAFWGCLTAWCEANGIRYHGVNVSTVKKTWTGRGNADKAAMIAAARARGFRPGDDNEADALAILHYALEVRGE